MPQAATLAGAIKNMIDGGLVSEVRKTKSPSSALIFLYDKL
ncbi:MAG: hypothetical protein WBE86_09990 [Candidatus Acidiferrales bacterium]